jgi:hypothetical protein
MELSEMVHGYSFTGAGVSTLSRLWHNSDGILKNGLKRIHGSQPENVNAMETT